MRGRKFIRMGAVLLMLLALVLPVAPAGAAGAVQDEGTVTAAAVTPRGLFDECAANAANQGKTSYFLTVVSSTSSRIPSGPTGVPASVSLIGTGSLNLNAVVPLTVGDFENKAQPGLDLGNGATPGTPNGVCTDTGGVPLDIPPQTVDGFANDYGNLQPVFTGPCTVVAGVLTGNCWKILVTAAGHASQILDVTNVIDGAPTGTLGPAGAPPFPQVPNTQAAYAGTGCLAPDRGCVVSIGTITLAALTVPQAGRGSIGGTVTDVNGLPVGGVDVVLYRQPDQDPTNDATNPIPENTAFSVLTDANTGQYYVNNLWPGKYSVTVADTRLGNPLVTCIANANCGLQPL